MLPVLALDHNSRTQQNINWQVFDPTNEIPVTDFYRILKTTTRAKNYKRVLFNNNKNKLKQ